jgi:hypothetical protein
VNHCHNRRRFWRRRRQEECRSIDELTPQDEARLSAGGGGGASPFEAVRRRERARRVQSALLDLSFEHRAVLLLREVEGLSCDAIAATLGLPEGTVKSRLARGREALRQRLAPRPRRGRVAHVSCEAVHRRLSAYLEGDLPPSEAGSVSSHLIACEACGRRIASLKAALAALAELPRLEAGEPIASRVFDRLEVESRGPGLALLFRSAGAARPLIVPSLLPAAAVLMSVLALVLSLGDACAAGRWR